MSGINTSKKPPSDKRFKEAYGKALAEALMKNEEYQREAILSTSTSASTSSSSPASSSKLVVPDEDLEKAYMSFCYDDPIIPADYLCHHLALRMVGSSFSPNAVKDATGGGVSIDIDIDMNKNQNKRTSSAGNKLNLALSDRFMKGILQASSRGADTTTSTNWEKLTTGGKGGGGGDDDDDDDDYTSPYSGEPIVPMSTTFTTTEGQGYTELSFMIFALSPLLSCRILLEHLNHSNSNSNNSNTTLTMTVRNIHSFLGSYNGNNNNHEENDTSGRPLFGTDADDDNQQQQQQQDATNLFLRSMAEMNMSNNFNNNSEQQQATNALQLDLDDMNIGGEEKKEKEKEKEGDAVETNSHDNDDDDDDDDSMKEIFAEESDPDDYDYGQDFDRFATTTSTTTTGGGNDSANAMMMESYGSFFDAKTLSQSKILTVDEIRHRIESLLSNLYHRRINLSTKLWKQWGASKVLVDLTLILLKCLKGGGGEVDEVGDGSGNHILERLGGMYTKPLIVLRDRSMDIHHGHDSMDDFLELVKILLKSQSEDVGTYASQNNKMMVELSPSRVIGLSSLSGLCSSSDIAKSPKRRIRITLRSMIMSSLDELLDCVEFVRPSVVISSSKNLNDGNDSDNGPTSTHIPTWVRVIMALLPILDIITGVKSRADYTSIHDGVDLKPISNAEAQSLLQTGLFRELILLYGQSSHDGGGGGGRLTAASAARELVREQLLRSIYVLSAQSPILAKYAARVPELTSILYSDIFLKTYTFDCILWYALLFQTLSRNNQGPQLQLRMKGAKVVSKTKTPQELKDICMKESMEVLKKCTNAIDDMVNTTSKTNNSVEDITLLYEFIRFTNCFHSIPVVAEHWVATVSSTKDGAKVARESISHILRSLAKLKPSSSTNNQKTEKSGVNTNNDDSKDEIGKNSRRGLDSREIASIRKGCKTMLLNLESLPTSNSNQARTSFMKASAASSKTD